MSEAPVPAAVLLDEPDVPGLVRARADVGDLVTAGGSAGRRVVVLGEATTRAAFLDLCARAFDLPEWFGGNLDALEESLGDLEVPPQGLLVVWAGWGALAEGDARTYAAAREVLAAAMEAWRAAAVPALTVEVVSGPADR